MNCSSLLQLQDGGCATTYANNSEPEIKKRSSYDFHFLLLNYSEVIDTNDKMVGILETYE